VADSLRTTAYGDDCICHDRNMTCQCALGLRTGDECKSKEEDNNNSSNDNPQPTGSSNLAIYLSIGLLWVVIAVVFIKRRKQADDLNTALVQGHPDISAF
jgi:hypothetical protein